MPALDRSAKRTCGDCGTSVTKQHLCRHKLSCSGGALHCPKSPPFVTESRENLNYQVAKKHSAAGPKTNHLCKDFSIESPSFYSLRHLKQPHDTAETTSRGEKAEMKSFGDSGDDKSLEEELQLCRHFLVDSDIERGRQSTFNFVVNSVTVHVTEEKLDRVMD